MPPRGLPTWLSEQPLCACSQRAGHACLYTVHWRSRLKLGFCRFNIHKTHPSGSSTHYCSYSVLIFGETGGPMTVCFTQHVCQDLRETHCQDPESQTCFSCFEWDPILSPPERERARERASEQIGERSSQTVSPVSVGLLSI